MGEKRNAYKLLVENPDGRPRRRWLANVRMDLVEVGWGYVDWIGLARSGSGQGQVESPCEFGVEPSGSRKCWETIECPNN
jgi:hypothetical protein